MTSVPVHVHVHASGICESLSVGEGTRIWAFAHVLPGASIGKNCNICDGVFVENDVVVGDDVTVKCGVQLWDGVRLGDRVFVGPNATFTNDKFPRSKHYRAAVLRTVVDMDASIGANATILPGIRIGRSAMIGAGAVVTKDVPAYAMVAGNPARVIRYLVDDRMAGRPGATQEAAETITPGKPAILNLPTFHDARGKLTVIEHDNGLPFVPRRSFVIFEVKAGETRGEHAHRDCKQFVVALAGQVRIMVDDGSERREVLLDSPTKGLHLPPMIWVSFFQFSANAVVQVFASLPYDDKDYIRDYQQFATMTHLNPG